MSFTWMTFEIERPLTAYILAELASIELNEGEIFVDGKNLWMFLNTIERALRTEHKGYPYLMGADSGMISNANNWEGVAQTCVRIAGLIENHLTRVGTKREK